MNLEVGRKESQGLKKEPWHLLPFDALQGIVKVLWYGAQKYTTRFESKWEGFWQTVRPIAMSLITPKGSVVTVMKDDFGKASLILRNANVKTPENGENETRLVNLNWTEIEEQIRNFEKEIKEPSISATSKDWESMNKLLKFSNLKDAQSAAQGNIYTLTTTILVDGSVEFFAVNTTTVSASLEIMFKGLKPLLNISETTTLLEISGQRNWEKGMAYSDVYGGVLRHLSSWWRREDKDPETNYSHLWHAGCGILFLITYEMRGIGTDDRPVI